MSEIELVLVFIFIVIAIYFLLSSTFEYCKRVIEEQKEKDMSQREKHLLAELKAANTAILILLILSYSINTVSASYPYNMGYENQTYIKYPGSGVHYIYENDSYFQYIGVRDISQNIPNLKSRWVEFMINKNGETVRIERCYNYDYCTIGNIKIQINWIFEGKEALATQFKILKVYS